MGLNTSTSAGFRGARHALAALAAVAMVGSACTPDPGNPPSPTQATVISIAAGDVHSCALASDGLAYCWGDYQDGKLGDGSALPANTAVQVVGLTSAVAIAAGADHSCAAVANGEVRCWGDNTYGQLGDWPHDSAPASVKVTGMANAVGVAVGDRHSCALRSDGTVACWGNNGTGQLGNGTNNSSPLPVDVLSANNDAIAISADGNTTCATLASGGAECWGWNNFGQLGGVDTLPSDQWWVPLGVVGATGVTSTAMGGEHGCMAKTDGTAECWGAGDSGQLGNGTTPATSVPVPVTGLNNVDSVYAGDNNSCALLTDGTVRCWGANDTWSLGDQTLNDSAVPVTAIDVASATMLAMGNEHSCALASTGNVWCWGSNAADTLGMGYDIDASKYPALVAGLPSPSGVTTPAELPTQTGFADLDVGASHVCGVMTDATVDCWGEGAYGKLGGTWADAHGPREVAGVAGAIDVSLGDDFSCALLADGTVQCWGRNYRGALGVGSTEDYIVAATEVVGITSAQSVGAGSDHACAVLAGGTVQCWGSNNHGQLGDGTYVDSNVPVDVVGLTGAVEVHAGTWTTCALLDVGTMKCWGDNGEGQLGNGTTTVSAAPVDVAGLAGVASFDIGAAHGCAHLADSTVRCWGSNGNGQVGNASLVDALSPATPAGVWQLAESVATGYYHTCALVSADNVSCWGRNSNRQLGYETAPDDEWRVPRVAASLPGVVALFGGEASTCALHTDTTVSCWGHGSMNRLGTGFLVDTSTPRKVIKSQI